MQNKLNGQNKNHFKRIVCDIDDTISFTTNRDFANAEPNIPLINKLNGLYDSGWEIVYCTSRGSLSCISRADAEFKYGNQIAEYFEKHGIKYTRISFMKELGAYYIDDKAILPNDFLNLQIQQISDNVLRRGDEVDITFPDVETALNKAKAFNAAHKYDKSYPGLIKVIGSTVTVQYMSDFVYS